MATRLRILGVLLLVALAAGALWQTSRRAGPAAAPAVSSDLADTPEPGGSLVGSVRAEPRSFNSYVLRGATEETISLLTQAKLLRVNRETDQIEPWLAESWEQVPSPEPRASSPEPRASSPEPRAPSPDGPVYQLTLRQGVTFSDGAPFTSADVLFAFEAAYDERTASPIGESLRVGGEPLAVRALGDHEIEIAFPSPYGPGLRLLDGLWILPRHKLEPALRDGTLADAWRPSTPPADIVGLGPFVLGEYRAGERLVFERNPRYWRRDAAGRPLPYLDRLTLEILPDQTAELLRIQSGQLDLTHSEIRSEDYASLRRASDEGRVRLIELGTGLDPDAFWFNLGGGGAPAAAATSESASRGAAARGGGAPRAVDTQAGVNKPWLRAREFRQAISLAVDRAAYSNAVFLGAGEPLHGPVTSGNTTWHWPELPGGEYDPERARTLLAGLDLVDRDGDGQLEDAAGTPVRFSVVLQRGIAAVERGAAFIRDALADLGVGLDIVGLDAGAVVARWSSGNYEAIFQRLLLTDTDPASALDFWLSSGSAHLWNPGQDVPATAWEREIDDLMRRQVASLDHDERVRLFREAQRIFSEQSPVLYFAAQHLYVTTSARLANPTPSRLRPVLLWSADTLQVSAIGR